MPSPALRGFRDTGFPLLGNLGSRASSENKVGANYEQLFRVFFSCFGGQKTFKCNVGTVLLVLFLLVQLLLFLT